MARLLLCLLCFACLIVSILQSFRCHLLGSVAYLPVCLLICSLVGLLVCWCSTSRYNSVYGRSSFFNLCACEFVSKLQLSSCPTVTRNSRAEICESLNRECFAPHPPTKGGCQVRLTFNNSFRLTATFLLAHHSCRFHPFSRCFKLHRGGLKCKSAFGK